jgi:plasmid stability protein
MTIRNIDDQLEGRLRVQAAKRVQPMEVEARAVLHAALSADPPQSLVDAIRARIEPLGGVELEIPAREPALAQPVRLTP